MKNEAEYKKKIRELSARLKNQRVINLHKDSEGRWNYQLVNLPRKEKKPKRTISPSEFSGYMGYSPNEKEKSEKKQ